MPKKDDPGSDDLLMDKNGGQHLKGRRKHDRKPKSMILELVLLPKKLDVTYLA